MNSPTRRTQRLRFGGFELDLFARELYRRGRKAKLQDHPFQILALLLENPGELVTRDELRKKLWPDDTFVDFDVGLNTAIKKLRDALGDSAENPRFVETLPRRGYRFIAPVDLAAGLVPAQQGHLQGVPLPNAAVGAVPDKIGTSREPLLQKRWALRVGGVALGVLILFGGLSVLGWRHILERPNTANIQSIAVLPLENLSGDKEQEYFADGMTDALITELGKIGALRVISRTSVMQYKGTRKPLGEIAGKLNVDGLVEGTVLRSGNRVRVTAQLIRAATEKHLWAESYEGDLSDILVLQGKVARAIATEIQIKLTPQEQLRLSSTRAVNPEAYADYLQGRYFFNNKQSYSGTFKKGTEYMQKAIEKDPNYAQAYAGLADGYAFLARLGLAELPPKKAWPKARAAAERALAIDDTLAEAHSSLAVVLFFYDWNWSGAEREFKRAIQLNPGYAMAHLWYSDYLESMGRFDEAIAEANRAQELDPLSLLANWNVARRSRTPDRAIAQLRRVLEMDPNYAQAHFSLGQLYKGKGLYREALAEYQTWAHSLSGDRVEELGMLALTCTASGDKPKARKLLAQALNEERRLERENKEATEGDLRETLFARIYVELGDTDEAFKWLDKAYDDRAFLLVQLKVARQWDPLRSDSRFQDLLRRVGLPP